MRWGLVARPELGRGLGELSRQIARWCEPDAVLCIDGCASGAGHPRDYDFGPAETYRLPVGSLSAENWSYFYDGLDAVLHLETPYQEDAFPVARDAGCRSSLWVMPEHAPWLINPAVPRPDAFWLPTTWRASLWPGALLQRVPCPPVPWRHRSEARRILHIAGQHTRQDRNGTKTFARTVPLLRGVEVVITTQSPDMLPRCEGADVLPHPPDLGPWLEWADVVVLPRRYGGLCLPALEAIAAGAVVLMPDVSPQNSDWPVVTYTPSALGQLEVVGGSLETNDVEPAALADAIMGLVDNPAVVAEASAAAVRFASVQSWERAAGRILAALW